MATETHASMLVQHEMTMLLPAAHEHTPRPSEQTAEAVAATILAGLDGLAAPRDEAPRASPAEPPTEPTAEATAEEAAGATAEATAEAAAGATAADRVPSPAGAIPLPRDALANRASVSPPPRPCSPGALGLGSRHTAEVRLNKTARGRIHALRTTSQPLVENLRMVNVSKLPAAGQASYYAALGALNLLAVRTGQPALCHATPSVAVLVEQVFAELYLAALRALLCGMMGSDGRHFVCCGGASGSHNRRVHCSYHATLLAAVDSALERQRVIFADSAMGRDDVAALRREVRDKALVLCEQILAPMRPVLGSVVPLVDLFAPAQRPLKRTHESAEQSSGVVPQQHDGESADAFHATKRMRPASAATAAPAAVSAPTFASPAVPALAAPATAVPATSSPTANIELYMYIPSLGKSVPVDIPPSAAGYFQTMAAVAVKRASTLTNGTHVN